MQIRLANPLQKDSVVDGPGIRMVVWTQGCPHHCKNCHNPETHDYDKGFITDTNLIIDEINDSELQDGLTFSGGDPMIQPLPCLEIAKYAKKIGLNVWCYTGFLFEQLLEIPDCVEFLKYVDVLVDGPFVDSLKSYSAKYRGSKNQRIINVKPSLKKKKAVLVKEYIIRDKLVK